MKLLLRWTLWLWISGVIVAALLWAPLAQNFTGLMGDAPQSSRIVYFHVPVALASFIAFMAAAIWSIRYLIQRRAPFDAKAVAAIEVGTIFCVLATVTGAVWSNVQWGKYWNWDPRQTSMALALLFYGAYLSLRGAIEDPEVRARLSAAYSALGIVVAPFLFFIMPRMASFSLHPKPGGAEMDADIGFVVLASTVGFTALFFWMQSLRARIILLESADSDLESTA